MTVSFLCKMLNPALKVIIRRDGNYLKTVRAANADSSNYGSFEIKDFEMSAVSHACIIEVE